LLVASCGKSNGLLPPPDASGGTPFMPVAATCTGAAITVTESNSLDSIGENVDATCDSVSGFLAWKMGATGSACTNPIDCTPACVPCPSGARHTLAGWCNHGVCAGPADVACAIAGTPGLKSCSD
jgi:hypothetical protein